MNVTLFKAVPERIGPCEHIFNIFAFPTIDFCNNNCKIALKFHMEVPIPKLGYIYHQSRTIHFGVLTII